MIKLIKPENEAEAKILRAAFGWKEFQDLGPAPRPGAAYPRSSFFMDSNSSRSISPLAKRSFNMSNARDSVPAP
jgi:hypothetical protein